MTRLFSAACERNRAPILEVLREVLTSEGSVLEVASGTGLHALHFARGLPHLTWQPSDTSDEALASIEAWREAEGPENLHAPVRLDVTEERWPIESAAAIFNANMTHISPFSCTRGLLAGAARVLEPGAPLVLYGPYQVDGAHTAPSNERFDQSLRSRDPSWGVRCLTEVSAIAAEQGLAFERRVSMPANNMILVFRR